MHILWLKTELLHPVDKGGRIRTYQMLRHLRDAHRVTYLTLDDGRAAPDAMERAGEYSHEVIRVPHAPPPKRSLRFVAALGRNLISPIPYVIARYRSPGMRDAITSAVRERNVDIVVCDFLTPSINVPSGLDAPVLLFQHNVESAIWERHAGVARNPLTAAYMRSQWRRMRAWEAAECRRVDQVVAVSEADKTIFSRDFGVSRVSAVATGVDTEYFRPSATARERNSIVFTGSMDWMPNEDGILWFVREVLPRIHAEIPNATLSIVGRNPPPSLRALAAPGVEVTGTVPDIRPYLGRSAVTIVPLRVGGGTRLKIFEAMAMENAVVSTTVGAEGLPVTDGVHLRIADSAAAFADSVVRQLRDPADSARIGAAAATLVRSQYSWDRVAADFAAACEDCIATARGVGSSQVA
jgi:sugar transferase (PEP-CTERM/EpsH1 system associated)